MITSSDSAREAESLTPYINNIPIIADEAFLSPHSVLDIVYTTDLVWKAIGE